MLRAAAMAGALKQFVPRPDNEVYAAPKEADRFVFPAARQGTESPSAATGSLYPFELKDEQMLLSRKIAQQIEAVKESAITQPPQDGSSQPEKPQGLESELTDEFWKYHWFN